MGQEHWVPACPTCGARDWIPSPRLAQASCGGCGLVLTEEQIALVYANAQRSAREKP